jgi:trans-aconitate methyltransferase
MELLEPHSGEVILDLGCGDGALTAEIARYGAHVIGVDRSIEMVAACHRRGVPAVAADGHRLCFARVFDAVFSNAAMHWMKDLGTVIAAIAAMLRKDGRFVGEMGGAGNIASVSGALRETLPSFGLDFRDIDPWVFPEPGYLRRLLRGSGFRVDSISLIARPTRVDEGVRRWLEVFAAGILDHVEDNERNDFLDQLWMRLDPDGSKTQQPWVADYVRLRFAARLERFPDEV